MSAHSVLLAAAALLLERLKMLIKARLTCGCGGGCRGGGGYGDGDGSGGGSNGGSDGAICGSGGQLAAGQQLRRQWL